MRAQVKLLICLVLLFAFATSARARETRAPLLVISDIDDTLQMTYLRPFAPGLRAGASGYARLLSGLVRAPRAFLGMPELYAYVQENGARIAYVSGAPQFLWARATRFLLETGFPQGDLNLRPSLKIPTGEYKFQRIQDLMRAHPDARVVLLGDNGEGDVAIYARLRASDIGQQIIAVYIHQLYPHPVGHALAEGQHGFWTAADLAALFYQHDLISESQAIAVAENVAQLAQAVGRAPLGLEDLSGLSARRDQTQPERLRRALHLVYEGFVKHVEATCANSIIVAPTTAEELTSDNP